MGGSGAVCPHGGQTHCGQVATWQREREKKAQKSEKACVGSNQHQQERSREVEKEKLCPSSSGSDKVGRASGTSWWLLGTALGDPKGEVILPVSLARLKANPPS